MYISGSGFDGLGTFFAFWNGSGPSGSRAKGVGLNRIRV